MLDQSDAATQALPLVKPSAHTEALTLVHLADVDPDPHNTLRMSDAELMQLGDSIDARGLFQPPLLRYEAHANRYTTIDGHHRIEAMRRKGFEKFWAIVGHAEDETALEMLMMANIHRKDMTKAQIADFVGQLYKKHKNLDKVCTIMKKSKPWVSKHLALTRPDFGAIARQMLTQGECEDLEVLGIISQLEKMEAFTAIEDLRAEPPISRAKAREALKMAKTKPANDEEEKDKEELPDMQEQSDLSGGETDCDKQLTETELANMIDRATEHGRDSAFNIDKASNAIAYLTGALKYQPKAAEAMQRLLDMILPK